MKKICHISMFYCPLRGGQERYIQNLIEGLAMTGVQSSVLQPPNGCSKESVYFAPRIPSALFGWIEGAQWFAFNVGLLFRRKFLKSQDILICHYPFHYPSISWHPNVIVISHGVLWSRPPHSLFDIYHQYIAKTLAHTKQPVRIVANDSDFLRDIGYNVRPKEHYFSEVAPGTWFIPNCVDTHRFRPDTSVQKRKHILIPRNVRPERGTHLALEAFALFVKKHPDFELSIAGKGAGGDYFKVCQEIITTHHIEDKVRFLGHLETDQLIQQYQSSMMTLITSTEKEGTSLSALESMACGTPTVLTDIAGLKDLPGLIAKPEPKDIAIKMEEIVEQYSSIATSQHKETVATFSVDKWLHTWKDVLRLT